MVLVATVKDTWLFHSPSKTKIGTFRIRPAIKHIMAVTKASKRRWKFKTEIAHCDSSNGCCMGNVGRVDTCLQGNRAAEMPETAMHL